MLLSLLGFLDVLSDQYSFLKIAAVEKLKQLADLAPANLFSPVALGPCVPMLATLNLTDFNLLTSPFSYLAVAPVASALAIPILLLCLRIVFAKAKILPWRSSGGMTYVVKWGKEKYVHQP